MSYKPEHVDSELALNEMHEYAKALALDMLQDMDDEESVTMIRDFCQVMIDWQPNIAVHREDPIMLGISCLVTAQLFKMCFDKAYRYTDKKIAAQEAIAKAFEL